MNQKYEKLKNLLRELFQLDKPDLDFGLYRIMHAKADEIAKFLDQDLLPQVKKAFEQYQPADKAAFQKELDEKVQQYEADGVNPDTVPRIQELRTKLATEAVDLDALENETYDHLYSFFRRYYSDGDFLSHRVYKPGVYAIPYEGEEVKLHWANRDQYYIKTSEYLRDFAFRLKPESDTDPMRVHFRLVDATEEEHANIKASNDKERRFILAHDHFISEDGGELIIHFQYRPATLTDWPEDRREEEGSKKRPKPPGQGDLICFAFQRVLNVEDDALTKWITELSRPDPTDTNPDRTVLEKQLTRYAARHTFDYFIHKDLGDFLRRELDFYIKNEVMHLDDVENESIPKVEQYLSKIKVIRRIAHKLIDFLAQLENFQKKLWLKKKFIVETNYCITLDRIPAEFYPEIADNAAQWREWESLFAFEHSYDAMSQKERQDLLTQASTVIVDTGYFDPHVRDRLINAIERRDEHIDGVLFHGNNFHAVQLIQRRYAGKVKSVYSDPPFNTTDVGFNYKNNYRHSSWCQMIANLMHNTRPLLTANGVVATAIDDFELHHLGMVSDETFGTDGRIGVLVVEIKPSGRTNDNFLATSHEYYLLYGPNPSAAEVTFFPLTEEQQLLYEQEDEQGAFKWRDFLRTGGYSTPEERPNSHYPIYYNRNTSEISLAEHEGWETIWPVDSENKQRVWRKTPPSCQRQLDVGEIRVVVRRDDSLKVEIIDRIKRGTRPKSVWIGKQYDAASHGTKLLKAMFGGPAGFSFPKSLYATKDVLFILAGDDDDCLILDYFAGSGTTGHATIDLNREDDGSRRYLLVEVGEQFDAVLVPRLKKAIYADKWRSGKPASLDTGISHTFKYCRLESYEDALNNLELARNETQQGLLHTKDAMGDGSLAEQYLLRYMLDVETRGSQSLLDIAAFTDPTAYKLKIKKPGSDETREVNVDLLETFNYLIGLTVQHIAVPQTFSAKFKRDEEGRLRLDGRITQDDEGPYWFRTVTGTMPDNKRTLIIWRKLTGDAEEDNLVLDEWFTRQGYSTKDFEFHLIYVNGDNNLENLKQADDTWKVRLIEEDFHRLMFDTEGL